MRVILQIHLDPAMGCFPTIYLSDPAEENEGGMLRRTYPQLAGFEGGMNAKAGETSEPVAPPSNPADPCS